MDVIVAKDLLQSLLNIGFDSSFTLDDIIHIRYSTLLQILSFLLNGCLRNSSNYSPAIQEDEALREISGICSKFKRVGVGISVEKLKNLDESSAREIKPVIQSIKKAMMISQCFDEDEWNPELRTRHISVENLIDSTQEILQSLESVVSFLEKHQSKIDACSTVVGDNKDYGKLIENMISKKEKELETSKKDISVMKNEEINLKKQIAAEENELSNEEKKESLLRKTAPHIHHDIEKYEKILQELFFEYETNFRNVIFLEKELLDRKKTA